MKRLNLQHRILWGAFLIQTVTKGQPKGLPGYVGLALQEHSSAVFWSQESWPSDSSQTGHPLADPRRYINDNTLKGHPVPHWGSGNYLQ